MKEQFNAHNDEIWDVYVSFEIPLDEEAENTTEERRLINLIVIQKLYIISTYSWFGYCAHCVWMVLNRQ